MKSFFIGVLCLIALGSCSEKKAPAENYVEVENIQEIYIDLPGSGNPQFDHKKITNAVKRQKANLAAVMVYYGIPVRYTPEGKITVPEPLLADTNFIYRITTLAKDTLWYRQHISPR